MFRTTSLISLAIVHACALSFMCSAFAQDCDECAVAAYLQSGFTPDADQHAAFQLNYRYRHEAYSGSSKQSGAPDEKVADSNFNVFYSARVLEPLFLDINLPITSKAYTERPNNTYDSDRESSLGDMSLLMTLQPYAEADKQGAVDWRVRAGAKLPTGDSDRLNSFSLAEVGANGDSNVYSYDHAIGSGSFDWIVGSSFFLRDDRFVGIADAQYIGRTTGENDFRFGDKMTAHVTPGYVFFQRNKDIFAFLVDSSFTFVGEADMSGATVPNTGESSFYMGPRILATFNDKFSSYVGVSLPVYHDMTGTQLAADYQIIASVMGAF
jgi:hypothetical protein